MEMSEMGKWFRALQKIKVLKTNEINHWLMKRQTCLS